MLKNLKYWLQYIDFSNELYKRVEALSTGQKKIVKLLSAFCCDCQYLILDEPTEGLDVENINKVKEILKTMKEKYNKVIVISSHDLNFLTDIATNYFVLRKGLLVSSVYSKLDFLTLTQNFFENKEDENEKIL